jgi:DNA-binding transcriptional LysR family regulator
MHSISLFHEERALIDLRRLRHIVTLARCGSYVRAAEELALTQPALSRSIQAAEADYGVRLFDRGRSGVTPTGAGRAIVADGERLLRDARALDEAMRRIGKGAAGEVAVGLGPLIASATLPLALPALLRDHPAVRMHIVVNGAPELLRQLAQDRIEFAICARDASLISEEFTVEASCDLPLALLARAQHPLSGRRVSAQEATGFQLIGGSTANRRGDNVMGYAPDLACDNYEILRGLTLVTDALWVSSPMLAQDELANGQMVVIDCPDLVRASYEAVMVTRRRRTQSPAALLVANQLTGALGMQQRPHD